MSAGVNTAFELKYITTTSDITGTFRSRNTPRYMPYCRM